MSTFVSRLGPESVSLFTPRAPLSERFERVPRYFIHCEKDRCMRLEIQKKLVERALVRRAFTLPTCHAPFLSAPGALLEVLEAIAREG